MSEEAQTQRGVNFSPLLDHQRDILLRQLDNSDLEIKLWKKGDKLRNIYSVKSFNGPQKSLSLKPTSLYDNSLTGKVLVSFFFNGTQFFSTGILSGSKVDKFSYLNCNGELFRCERRRNFRLPTFPDYDARGKFFLDKCFAKDTGELIRFKRVQPDGTQTHLFKQFLKLVEGGEKTGFVDFRVLDVSVSGLALMIGETGRDFFVDDMGIRDMEFLFDNDFYKIDEAEIAYIIDFINPKNPKVKHYKVGVHFVQVSTNVDENLGNLINTEMRNKDFQYDFEGFLGL